MVLFLGGARCVAAYVPDTLVYGPVYIPSLLGRCAHHMGPTPVRRYVMVVLTVVLRFSGKCRITRSFIDSQ